MALTSTSLPLSVHRSFLFGEAFLLMSQCPCLSPTHSQPPRPSQESLHIIPARITRGHIFHRVPICGQPDGLTASSLCYRASNLQMRFQCTLGSGFELYNVDGIKCTIYFFKLVARTLQSKIEKETTLWVLSGGWNTESSVSLLARTPSVPFRPVAGAQN